MKYLLSQTARTLLERYAWSRTLLAFDFDGTLAPIVDRPEDAEMRAATRTRMAKLARRYPCVVISGRGLADVTARMVGVPVVAIVGNHGLEPSKHMHEHAATVSDWLPRLHHDLGADNGIEIENKRYSLAIHYRRSRTKVRARALIATAVQDLGPGVRAIGGKQVVNVVPLGAPHKGIALERLRAQLHMDTAIYVGDDITDEDVFGLDQPGQLLSIRIGKIRNTAAPYYLRDQSEIDDLLDQLIALRATATSHRLEQA